MTIADLNSSDQAAFVRVCGPLFEKSPWIAERTFPKRPFSSVNDLYVKLCATMQNATDLEKMQLIQSHPDLVGKLAREGKLTRESTSEQAAAGLAALSDSEVEAFEQYNAKYRAKFGFPFIICARENRKESILESFPIRLRNTKEREIETALLEITKIAKLRLLDAVEE